MKTFPVIAIDGHAGSGKGTAAEKASKKLGFRLCDSGSIYRAITYMCLAYGRDPQSSLEVSLLVDKHMGLISVVDGVVHFAGSALGPKIRTREIDKAVPLISAIPHVREAVLPLQRGLASEIGLVAEGRDLGSVVFPNAQLKIFMTAPVEVRAQRRLAQYQKTGVVDTKSLGDIRLDLEARDRCDETRSDSPLVCVPDAYVVDTSLLDEEEVPTLIVNLWQQL